MSASSLVVGLGLEASTLASRWLAAETRCRRRRSRRRARPRGRRPWRRGGWPLNSVSASSFARREVGLGAGDLGGEVIGAQELVVRVIVQLMELGLEASTFGWRLHHRRVPRPRASRVALRLHLRAHRRSSRRASRSGLDAVGGEFSLLRSSEWCGMAEGGISVVSVWTKFGVYVDVPAQQGVLSPHSGDTMSSASRGVLFVSNRLARQITAHPLSFEQPSSSTRSRCRSSCAQSARTEAIDYAQLANGSMSVEDADESPPPQSAGNGKQARTDGGRASSEEMQAPAACPRLRLSTAIRSRAAVSGDQAKLLALFRKPTT